MPTEELFGNFHFLMEISGSTVGTLRAVEGLSDESAFVSEKVEWGPLKWKLPSLESKVTMLGHR